MTGHGRYHRQTILPEIGGAGQQRLAAARVAIVGVGALGCASADVLVRAGVGEVRLIDRDVVEETNLQRQGLYDERDAAEGLPKVLAARRRLAAVNSTVRIIPVNADLTSELAELLLGFGTDESPHVIVDGTDNFETRYLLNDVAVKQRVPLIYGGAVGYDGMSAAFVPGGPCMRCIWPAAPAPGSTPTCDTVGVLGATTMIVGAWQGAAALRWIVTGEGSGMLRHIDAWKHLARATALGERDSECVCCGERRFEFLETPSGGSVTLCGRDAVQVSPQARGVVDLPRLADRLGPHGAVVCTEFMVRARMDGLELTVFADGRAIVKGTTDPARARSVYARYIGA